MKFVFITLDYPIEVNDYLMLPSLDFTTMSQVAKQNGVHCELVDMRINHFTMQELEKILIQKNKESKIDFICIESECCTHFNAVKAIKVCRHALGRAVLIGLRGEVTTFLPVQTYTVNHEYWLIF